MFNKPSNNLPWVREVFWFARFSPTLTATVIANIRNLLSCSSVVCLLKVRNERTPSVDSRVYNRNVSALSYKLNRWVATLPAMTAVTLSQTRWRKVQELHSILRYGIKPGVDRKTRQTLPRRRTRSRPLPLFSVRDLFLFCYYIQQDCLLI